jgi:hypothetical protein
MSMRVELVGGLILACTGTLWAGDKTQSLDINLGLWEITTTQDLGPGQFSPEALAKLSPAERAKFEEVIKQNAAAGPKTKVVKMCLTKEKLIDGSAFNREGTCRRNVTTPTNTRLDLTAECMEKHVRKNFLVHVEAINPESVRGSVQALIDGGDRTVRVNSTLTGKWLGSECGNIESAHDESSHHEDHHP